MSSRPTFRSALAGAAVLSLLLVSQADAQLGGALRRAASRAAGGAAVGAATNAGAPVAAAPGQQRGPEFDDNTLEITPEVLGRFVTALGTERRERASLAADRQRAAGFRAQTERYERCLQRAEDEQQDANAQRRTQDEAMAYEAARAAMRGDTAAYRRMVDSLTANRGPKSGACGERPNEAYRVLRRIDAGPDALLGIAADAGGFSSRQYAILRERIAPYVLSGGEGRQEMGYVENEKNAMRARMAELRTFEPELRS